MRRIDFNKGLDLQTPIVSCWITGSLLFSSFTEAWAGTCKTRCRELSPLTGVTCAPGYIEVTRSQKNPCVRDLTLKECDEITCRDSLTTGSTASQSSQANNSTQSSSSTFSSISSNLTSSSSSTSGAPSGASPSTPTATNNSSFSTLGSSQRSSPAFQALTTSNPSAVSSISPQSSASQSAGSTQRSSPAFSSMSSSLATTPITQAAKSPSPATSIPMAPIPSAAGSSLKQSPAPIGSLGVSSNPSVGSLPGLPPNGAGPNAQPSSSPGTQSASDRFQQQQQSRLNSSGNAGTTAMMLGAMSGNPMLGFLGAGGDCSVSQSIQQNFSCGGTRALTMGAQLASTTAQQAGSMAVSTQSQTNYMKASGSNSQEVIMQTAVDNARLASQTELGTGGLNATFGVLQLMRARTHGQNATQLSEAAGAQVTENTQTKENEAKTNDLAETILKNQNAKKDQLSAAQSLVQQVGTSAASEQKEVQSLAMMGGVMSLATGMTQMLKGGLLLNSANQMQESVNRLKTSPSPKASFASFQPMGGLLPPSVPIGQGGAAQTNAGSGASINPISGSQGASSQMGPNANPSGLPDVGPGFLTGITPNAIPSGPPAGSFIPDQGGGGGGGGGSVDSGGGGGTQPSDVNADGHQPFAAQGGEGGLNYGQGSSGGAATSGGGYSSGGGKAASSGGDGLDLAGLLSKFLPKKEEEAAKRGLLEMNPTGTAGNYPFLAPGVNLFDRIHEAYQRDRRQGII